MFRGYLIIDNKEVSNTLASDSIDLVRGFVFNEISQPYVSAIHIIDDKNVEFYIGMSKCLYVIKEDKSIKKGELFGKAGIHYAL